MTKVAWLLIFASSSFACGGRTGDDSPSDTWGIVGGVGGDRSEPRGAPGGSPWIQGYGGLPSGGGTTVASTGATAGLVSITATEIQTITDRACQGYAVESDPPILLLSWVVDASASMGQTVSAEGKTRWELTQESILAAMREYHASRCYGGYVSMFAYPRQLTGASASPLPITMCIAADVTPRDIDMLPAADLNPLSDYLSSVSPMGGTPTLDAYRKAASAIERSTLWVDMPTIVLVSDGMPTLEANCRSPSVDPPSQLWPAVDPTELVPASTDAIIREIESMSTKMVRTLVVGAPGSEVAKAWLSRAAMAGGLAKADCNPEGFPYCHVDLTVTPRATDWLKDLVEIHPVMSCSFEAAKPPDGRSIARVYPIISTGTEQWLIQEAPVGTSCVHGYQYVGPTTIQFCPDTCALLNSCGTAVTILYEC